MWTEKVAEYTTCRKAFTCAHNNVHHPLKNFGEMMFLWRRVLLLLHHFDWNGPVRPHSESWQAHENKTGGNIQYRVAWNCTNQLGGSLLWIGRFALQMDRSFVHPIRAVRTWQNILRRGKLQPDLSITILWRCCSLPFSCRQFVGMECIFPCM